MEYFGLFSQPQWRFCAGLIEVLFTSSSLLWDVALTRSTHTSARRQLTHALHILNPSSPFQPFCCHPILSFLYSYVRDVIREDAVPSSRIFFAEPYRFSDCSESLHFTGFVGRPISHFFICSCCDVRRTYWECFVHFGQILNDQSLSTGCSCNCRSCALLVGINHASGNFCFQFESGKLPGIQKCQELWSKG